MSVFDGYRDMPLTVKPFLLSTMSQPASIQTVSDSSYTNVSNASRKPKKNKSPNLLYTIYAILACLNVLLPIKICLKKKIIRPVRSQRGKLLILIDNLNNVNFEAYFFFYFCVILLVSPSA